MNTTSATRRTDDDAALHVATASSSLGWILVARGAGGIRAILLGDDSDELAANLRERVPDADARTGGADVAAHAAALAAHVERPAVDPDLPLDPRGTPFQMRVWRALRAIPPGATASYAEIARTIGAPDAARAVAGACGANPLAVAIPCHRAVRGDGGLSGYRWGVHRKRELLRRETAARPLSAPS